MELPVKSPVSRYWKTSSKLETKNLSYNICSDIDEFDWVRCMPKKSPKFILKNVNFEARPGEITAIAGPSGAGKTTLLEILAGKISRRRVAGQVHVNGSPINGKYFRKISGYVTQDDVLFPSLTVEETLMYSALLRLPSGYRQNVAVRVKGLLKELGLDHVARSRIGEVGSDFGISGGERRRVSIGVELVHDPDVVLIDEPTSGLDSASALHIVAIFKSMVIHQGKTIVLTIHQPGFRILQLLDRLVLLSNGSVVHNGTLALLESRLHLVGHHIPPHVNVLEFAVDVIESMAIQNNDDRNGKNSNLRREYPNNIHKEKGRLTLYRNSQVKEIQILGQRFCKNIFRTKQLFLTRVIQAIVAGLILGTIYFNVGSNDGKRSNISRQTRIGFFAFSLTFLLSSTTEGLPIFLQERKILMRETSRGAYRVSSYVLSNTLVFIPFLLMVCLLFTTPVYWLVGLRREIDGFLYFSLVVWLVLLMSNSFVACFSALVPNFIMGTSVISGLMGSFFLFSGYFISKEKIPKYWIFMHYLSMFKYPFECLMINEYGGEQGGRRCIEFSNQECSLYGSGFLMQQNLKESQKWSNLSVMFSFIIGYRVLCFLILWFRCYRTRN